MKILVTGGCGFIGSNFVNYIMRKHPDWGVRVLDKLTYAGSLENIDEDLRKSDRFQFIYGDILNRELVEDSLTGIDVVIHYAAESHVAYSLVQADLFTEVNAKGTSILCESVINSKVRKFINISTSEVYGNCQYAPMNEEHPLLPRSPYAGSKAAADRLAYSYYTAFQIPLVIVRPFNNYGPFQHTEKVIPRFITTVLQGNRIEIHDDGQQTRDWLYVEDNAEAIERIILSADDDLIGEVINLGSGREVSIMEIAGLVVERLGASDDAIAYGEKRPGQVLRHISCIDKAKLKLGWKAKTSFEDGIARTIQWYVDNPQWWKNLKYPTDVDLERGIST